MLDRNLMSAVAVEKLLDRGLSCSPENTLEKSPVTILTVGKFSVISQLLESMREYTLARNPVKVFIVKRPLSSRVSLLGIG